MIKNIRNVLANKNWFYLVYYNIKRAKDVQKPLGYIPDGYKLIYYSVPKSGCSTMKNLLLQYSGKIKADEIVNVHAGKLVNDKDAPKLFQHIKGVPGSEYDDYVKYIVVRNPWDRLVSCYQDKIVKKGKMNIEAGINEVDPAFERYNKLLRIRLFKPEMSFESFVNLVSMIPDSASDMHIRSQYTFASWKSRFIPSISIKIENMHENLHKVDEGLAELYHSQKTRRNATNRKSYQEYYDERLKNKVAKRYKKDIELFNYNFENN